MEYNITMERAQRVVVTFTAGNDEEALKKADDQSIAWKATGVCPFCGGKISLVFKKCKSCKRSI